MGKNAIELKNLLTKGEKINATGTSKEEVGVVVAPLMHNDINEFRCLRFSFNTIVTET